RQPYLSITITEPDYRDLVPRYFGLEPRSPNHQSVAAMAAKLVASIMAAWPSGPALSQIMAEITHNSRVNNGRVSARIASTQA
ncbi:MAG: hypothetical protein ACPG07_03735, partial [Henriciella sp.]